MTAETAPAPARESFADLCRRAADRLDEIHRCATDSPWRAEVTVLDDTAIRATADDQEEIAVTYWPPDATLIVTLRPLAPLLAAYLREKAHSADVRERTVPGFTFKDHAIAGIARTILQEPT